MGYQVACKQNLMLGNTKFMFLSLLYESTSCDLSDSNVSFKVGHWAA